MLHSQITTRRVSLWSMMSLFAVLLFLVPTAFTVAQDYDAVIERLKQAVDAKEISPEQAKKMLATLKISSVKQVPAVKSPVKKDASHAKVNWEAIKKQVEGAVKAGKITREQADAKYTALKKQSAQKPAPKKDVSNAKVDWEAVEKKIEGAVKAGKLTREQADAKYTALKKQLAQKPAVKKVEGKPKSAAPAKPAVKKDASHAKVNWEVIKKKIEGAVKAGTITREQADARYAALKKQSAQKPAVKKDVSNAKVDWDAIEKRIEGAVKAGTITREQADARYAALKKQSAQKPPVKKDAGKPKALPAKPAAKKKPQ